MRRQKRIPIYTVVKACCFRECVASNAEEAGRWAEARGIDRSTPLREALRRHLDRLASEGDAGRWEAQPLDEGERSLAAVAAWGPAEDRSDRSDWSDGAADATR